MTIKNTIHNPKVFGHMSVMNGKLSFPALGTVNKNIELKLLVDDNRLSIDKFNVTSRGGTLTSSGYTQFNEKNVRAGLHETQISLVAKNFLAVNNRGMLARLNGNIQLKGDLENLKYEGSINIPRSRFNIEGLQKTSEINVSKPLLVKNLPDSTMTLKKREVKKRY